MEHLDVVSFNSRERNNFLGIPSVPMKKLFTSKESYGVLKPSYIHPLFWLLDSGKMAQHLHHVPWERLQMFQPKALMDVKIARQVTSSFFYQSSEDMTVCASRAGSEIEP